MIFSCPFCLLEIRCGKISKNTFILTHENKGIGRIPLSDKGIV